MPEEVGHQITCSVGIDIGLRAVVPDAETTQTHKVVFSKDQICLNMDGSMKVTFFSITNDMDYSGSAVLLPPTKVPKNLILHAWLQAIKLFRH